AAGTADLRLELPPGAGRARVALVPIRPPEGRLDAPIELGEFASGDTIHGIEPGPYRVLVRLAGGAFAELQRSFEADALVVARGPPTRAGIEGDVMVRGDGGSAQVSLDGHDDFALACDAFWIDRSPVTNREFREFLVSTQAWPPSEWSAKWLDVWDGKGSIPRRSDWDDLPVVRVSWTRAREYAEWKGKRLPTVGEWLLALGFHSDKIEAGTWRTLEPTFAFGRPQFQSLDGAMPTTSAAYLAFALPVRSGSEHVFGPNRIEHPFGNVSQW